MKKDNPYTLVFGKEPLQLISRMPQSMAVIDSFTRNTPSQMVYMITGIRGSGKTVFMTEIASQLKKDKDWIVVELNPDRDLLQSFAAKLTSIEGLAQIFQNAKLNLSFLGFGMEVSGAAPILDIETAISRMLLALKAHHKRVLVLIDEVTNTKEMRIFASAYQILIRQDLPVFLLMTGLYENIRELQDEKNLTFLYRAPRIELKPLNITSIAQRYKKVFSLDDRKAEQMAGLTKGYPFAFQVMGYFTWEVGGNYEAILDDYRQYLEEYVYEKIWSELSREDRRVAYAVASSPTGKISEIREQLDMDTNHFTPYRTRLIRKGILEGDVRGYVHFVLPLFEDFVKSKFY